MFLMQAEDICKLQGNRIGKGPKDSVKIKVYTASGLCQRTFHRGQVPFK